MYKEQLDTPYVLLDLDKTERNISLMQKIADDAGVALRPHTKTHKMPIMAHKQILAGARGITVAKLGEAEVMAAGGVSDIRIAYPIVGEQKLGRLVGLSRQVNLSVAIDSFEAALAISEAASAVPGTEIGVLLEIDCGFKRVGVQPGEPALALAKRISVLPGIRFCGISTFAGHSYDTPNDQRLEEISAQEGKLASDTAELLRSHGIPVELVSAGSTPSAPWVAKVPGVTEIRPGTYVFGDLMQVANRAHQLENCALSVKVTVVSRPEMDRAVIDAGTKVFTSDGDDSPIGTGRGYVINRPGVKVAWFTEEHGMLTLPPEDHDLKVGDTLEIIPVHACAVMNMVDEVAAVRGDFVEAIWPVLGRGKVR